MSDSFFKKKKNTAQIYEEGLPRPWQTSSYLGVGVVAFIDRTSLRNSILQSDADAAAADLGWPDDESDQPPCRGFMCVCMRMHSDWLLKGCIVKKIPLSALYWGYIHLENVLCACVLCPNASLLQHVCPRSSCCCCCCCCSASEENRRG